MWLPHATGGSGNSTGFVFGYKARKKIKRGDLVASFQYVNGEESMCLTARRNVESGVAIGTMGVVIIGLSSAWKYADDDYCIGQARKYAEVMGFSAMSKQTVHRIMTFIQDMLIELLTMKPMPLEANLSPEVVDVQMGPNSARVIIEEPRMRKIKRLH